MRHRTPGTHAGLKRADAVRRYRKGGSTRAIAAEFKVHPKCILWHLKQAGVSIRPRSENAYPSGENHAHWKGGRFIEKRQGYVFVNIGHGKRQLEHRQVMERALGRTLSREEHVHHLNGIRHDNRLENLALTTP